MEYYGLTYTWIGARDHYGTNNMVFLGSGAALPDNSTLWATSQSEPNHQDLKDCVYSSRKCCNGQLLTYYCTRDPDPFICEQY